METEIVQETFDYTALDVETRIVVQQRTEEIRVLVRRSAQDIVDIGTKLVAVREMLGDQRFHGWLRAEFDWGRTTAYRFIGVAERFGCSNLGQLGDFAPSALYLLAAPSTPEDARQEALERAAGGETITHATAKAIVAEHKPVGDEERTDDLRILRPELVDYGWRQWKQASGMWLGKNATLGLEVRDASERGLAARMHNMTPPDVRRAANGNGRTYESAVPVVTLPTTTWRDLEPPMDKKGLSTDGEEDEESGAGVMVALADEDEEEAGTVEILPADDTVVPVSQRDGYESDEWYTPLWFIKATRDVMGGIDIDPASCEIAQTVVRADGYLTRFDDGLQYRWEGRVFLNPPYSKPAEFVTKLLKEVRDRHTTEAIVLVNNATETSWFQALLLADWPVCFLNRRLAFWRHDHSDVGARQGQAVFYFGPNEAKFRAVFGGHGTVLRRVGVNSHDRAV